MKKLNVCAINCQSRRMHVKQDCLQLTGGMATLFKKSFSLVWVWGPGSSLGVENSQTLIYLEFSGSKFSSLFFNLFLFSLPGFQSESVLMIPGIQGMTVKFENL